MPTTMHNDQINTPSAVATWCFVVGAVLGVLGLISISTPWAAAATVDVFCGIMLVAGGVSQLAMTAATFSWRGFWLTLMCGVLSMMAGIGMLVLPNAGIEALVLFLAVVLLFEASLKITAAFTIRHVYPWGWLLFDGMITALLGIILIASKPAESAVLLGVFVGVNLLSSGAMLAAAGWSIRRASALT